MTDLQEYRREQSRQILEREYRQLRREYWKRKEWKWSGAGDTMSDASS